MTSTDTKEYFTGKVSYYIFKKNSRNPLFLQRNIRCVLDGHKKRLAHARNRKPGMKDPKPLANGYVEPEPAAERKWSTREIIYILERKTFSERDPVLRIDVTAIRDRFAKFRDAKGSEEPPKKQAKVSPIEATCSLTIWDSTSGTFDTVVEQSRKCEISPESKPSGERYASVELSEPFVVPLQKLLPKRDRASQTYGEQLFSMQLAIMAVNATDRWPPVDTKLPSPKAAHYRDATGHLVRFPVLVAKWLRLPRVPESESESLLEIFASQDQNKYKPKLSLKIDAQWMHPPSPLAAYNSEFRHGLASPQESSSSASVSERTSLKSIVKTDWIFEGLTDFMDRLSFDGYTCPLCNARQFRDADEFHFHLVTGHDVFKFTFSVKFNTNSLGQPTVAGFVRVDVADGYERKLLGKHPSDFREMRWIRPEAPFDLEAFLKGDESWLGKSTRRNTLLVPPPQLERSSSSREVTRDVPAQATTRPPDQVPDLVPSTRKKFRVPRAPPKVRFYRTVAKCPLNEGDEVSESDDEIDEEWLLEKHRDTIDSFTDTLPQEKRFMQVYDRHMLQEDVSSDLHAGEALIRFCRANKLWLQNPSMRLEFSKKAAALKLQGALSLTVIRACLAIINSPTPMSPENEDAMDVDKSPKLAAVPDSARKASQLDPYARYQSSYRPLTPPEIGHIYGRCALCSEAILDMRKNIRCSNPTCFRANYHLSCIGLAERETGWLCNECRVSGLASETQAKLPKEAAPATNASAAASSATPSLAPVTAPLSPPTSTSALAANEAKDSLNGPMAGDRLAIRSRDSSPSRNATREGSKQLTSEAEKLEAAARLDDVVSGLFNGGNELTEKGKEARGGQDTTKVHRLDDGQTAANLGDSIGNHNV